MPRLTMRPTIYGLLATTTLSCCHVPWSEAFSTPPTLTVPPHRSTRERRRRRPPLPRQRLPTISSSSTISSTVLAVSSDENHPGRRPPESSATSTTPLGLWQSHVSTHPDHTKAVQKVFDDAAMGTNHHLTPPPDLAFLFVGQFHAAHFDEIVQLAWKALGNNNNNKNKTRLVSIVGGGVIGDGVELDESSKPSLSLLMGCLPPPNSSAVGRQTNAIEFLTFNGMDNPPPDPASEYWRPYRRPEDDPTNKHPTHHRPPSFLVFADPWSPVDVLLHGLGDRAVVAGAISVPTGTGSTIALDGTPLPQGSLAAVCFCSASLLHLQIVVAQGCRPVSPMYRITAADGSCILELDHEPAMRVLEAFLQGIESTAEQTSVSSGLVCGIRAAAKDDDDDDKKDDFLIRQILGFVPQKGGIAVAGGIQAGETLCFHVRDKNAAQEDLELMVARAKTERLFRETEGTPVAAIQISCVARGRYLFGVPNIDISQTKELLDGPVAGLYANGEIGPVGLAGFTSTERSSSFLHGFTTVVALLSATGSAVNDDDDDSTIESIDKSAGVWG